MHAIRRHGPGPARAIQVREGIIRVERGTATACGLAPATSNWSTPIEDGTVSIFGLVFGVAAASPDSRAVLLAGATGAISAAVSMMAGTFLDVETANDQACVPDRAGARTLRRRSSGGRPECPRPAGLGLLRLRLRGGDRDRHPRQAPGDPARDRSSRSLVRDRLWPRRRRRRQSALAARCAGSA